MKVYLAAAWSRREEMKSLAAELEHDIPGLIVNARWIKEEPSSNRWFVPDPAKNAGMNREPAGMGQFEMRRFRAQQDREDVLDGDVLVRFSDDLTPQTVPSYLATGSRMVEMGMVIGWIEALRWLGYTQGQQKSILVVGGFQPIFDYLPEVTHLKDVEELKRELTVQNALYHTDSSTTTC
jgi:hypothetical protein